MTTSELSPVKRELQAKFYSRFVTCKLPYLVRESLHIKRNWAMRITKKWLQYKFKCLSSIVLVYKFSKEYPMVNTKQGGRESGNHFMQKKKLLIWCLFIYTYGHRVLSLDFLSLGSNYGKLIKQGSYTWSTQMLYCHAKPHYASWLN